MVNKDNIAHSNGKTFCGYRAIILSEWQELEYEQRVE